MTKILFTASRVSHLTQFHMPYLSYYANKGIKIYTAAQGQLLKPKEYEKMDIQHLDCIFEKKALLKNWKTLLKIRALIKKENIDIVISNATLAGILTRSAILFLKKRPVIIHNCHGYLFSKNTPFLKKTVLLFIEKFFSFITNLTITMNKEDFLAAKKYKLGKNIKNIPGMGIPEKKEIDSNILNFDFPKHTFVFTYAAEFSGRKNQATLIQFIEPFLNKHKECILVLPGLGITLNECKKLSASLPCNKQIIFPGFVTPLSSLIKKSDIILSSSKSEGLPFSIMESMQEGKPVLLSRIKGHTDLIEDGQNGFLFSLDSPEEFRTKLEKLLSDVSLQQSFSTKCKIRSNLFSIKNVFNIVLAVYSSADSRLF